MSAIGRRRIHTMTGLECKQKHSREDQDDTNPLKWMQPFAKGQNSAHHRDRDSVGRKGGNKLYGLSPPVGELHHHHRYKRDQDPGQGPGIGQKVGALVQQGGEARLGSECEVQQRLGQACRACRDFLEQGHKTPQGSGQTGDDDADDSL